MYDNSHFHLKFFSVSLITGSLLSIILGRLGKLPLDAHDAIFLLELKHMYHSISNCLPP